MWQEERTSTARLPKGKAIVNHNANQIRTLEPIVRIKTLATIPQNSLVTIGVPFRNSPLFCYALTSGKRSLYSN
jgi:hypothetical protein